MQRQLLDILACPVCTSTLELEPGYERFELAGSYHVVGGVLACLGGHRFPIIDEVPRLVRESALSAAERASLDPPRQGVAVDVPRRVVASEAFEREIAQTVETSYRLGPETTPETRARAASEVEYLLSEYRGDNKRKYGRLLRLLALTQPTTVLDVGGYLPGMLRALTDTLHPRHGIVVDLDARFANAFKTARREFTLVRADACALPFQPGSIDLVVSAFALEHVPTWRDAVSSMLTAGRQAVIAFGPNRWFPFEIGHLDAPLAGTLPKPMARYVAWAWLKCIGKGRPLHRIEEILQEVTHISSREFRRACRALDIRVRNVFPEMVELVASDSAAPSSLPRRILRAWPPGARVAARVLARIGLEPQMYYFLEPRTAAQ